MDGVGGSRGDCPVSCISISKGGDSLPTGECNRGIFACGDLRGDGLSKKTQKLSRKDFPAVFPVDGVSGVSTGRGSTEESWRDGFSGDRGEPRRGDGFPVDKDFQAKFPADGVPRKLSRIPAGFPVDGVSGVSTGRGSTEESWRDGFSGDSGEPRRGDRFPVNSGGGVPSNPVKPRFPAAWVLANEKPGGGGFETVGDGANDLLVPGL